jgi:molecular chaperone GrpE (heat shock protein)
MDDAERYSAEFGQLMRDTEAQAERAKNRDREAVWKAIEKSFSQLAEAHNWSPEKCAASKKYLLDHFWD